MKKGEWVVLIVIIIVFVLVFSAGGYVVYKDFFSKDADKPDADSLDNPTGGGTSKPAAPKVSVCDTAGPVNPYTVLKRGSKSKEVCLLQQYLNLYNNAKLTVDGDYGPKTEFAVKMYISNTGMTTLDNVEARLQLDFLTFKKLTY